MQQRLGRFLHIQSGEWGLVTTAFSISLLGSIAFILLIAIRNTLFLTNFDISILPYFFLSAGLINIFISIIYGWLLKTGGTAQRNMLIIVALIGGVVYSWQQAQASTIDQTVIFIICLFTTVVSFLLGLIISSSIISSLGPRQDKRLLPLIGAGATTGAIVGGVIIMPLVTYFDTNSLFLVIGAAVILIAPLLLWLNIQSHRHWTAYSQSTQIISSGINNSWSSIAKIPLLRFAVLAAFSIKAITLLVQFLLMQSAQTAFSYDPGQIAIFFGQFYLWVSVATLALQVFLVNRIALRFGILPVAVITPILIAIAITTLAFDDFLAFVIIAAVTDICTFTFYKASQGMSFTPFEPGMRRQADVVTTGGAEPFAIFSASLFLILVSWLDFRLTIVAVIALIILWLYKSRPLRKHYLSELQNALDNHKVLSQSNKDVLHDIDHDARELLVNKLRASNDATEIEFILAILHEHHSSGCLDVAISKLHSPDVAIRKTIYAFLNDNGQEANAQDVWACVTKEDDDDCMIAGISAMRTVGNGALAANTAQFIHHGNAWIRVHALLTSFRENVEADDMDMLTYQVTSLSSDPNPSTRCSAAYYLTKNTLNIDKCLSRLIADSDNNVQKQAFIAVAEQQWMQHLALLIKSATQPSLIPLTRNAIAACGEASLQTIDSAIADDETGYYALLACIRGLSAIPMQQQRLLSVMQNARLSIRTECALQLINLDMSEHHTVLEDLILHEIHRYQAILIISSRLTNSASLSEVFYKNECMEYLRNSIHFVFLMLNLRYPRQDVLRAYYTYTSTRLKQQHVVEYLDSVIQTEWKPVLITILDDLTANEKITRLSQLHSSACDVDEPWLLQLSQTNSDANNDKEANMLVKIERLYHLKQVPFLSHIPSEDLLSLTDALEAISITANTVIFEQGDAPDYFYIIVSGSVEVSINNKVLNTLSSGDAFGEIAVLNEQSRSTTIRTHEDCNLLRMSQQQLSHLLEQYPQIARGVIKQLAGYVQTLTSATAD